MKKFEHWDDNYNKEDLIEIKKSEAFLKSNELELLKIYNAPKGVINNFTDGKPFVVNKSVDTITYIIPGGLFPTSREEYINDKEKWTYYIESIRKDGRLGIIVARYYKFLKEKNKLYYLSLASSLSIEDQEILFEKMFETESDLESDKIAKEIKSHEYYKRELIFDFNEQNEIGNIKKLDSNRYSNLIGTHMIEGVKYYRFKTNITFMNLSDREFVIDRECNFYLIEGHKFEK